MMALPVPAARRVLVPPHRAGLPIGAVGFLLPLPPLGRRELPGERRGGEDLSDRGGRSCRAGSRKMRRIRHQRRNAIDGGGHLTAGRTPTRPDIGNTHITLLATRMTDQNTKY